MKLVLGSIAAAIAAAAFFLAYPWHPVLTVTAVKRHERVLCLRMEDGEEFLLVFTHSVNKRPVEDTIRVQGDHLVVVKSRYDAFGAGMPEASANGMTLRDAKDGWLEWIANQPRPQVSFFVGWVADHRLRVRGRDIIMTRVAEPGTLVSLRTDRLSWWGLWKGRCAP